MNAGPVFREALWSCAAALSFFLTSCGPSTEFYRTVEANVSRGKYQEAIDGVRENRSIYGDKSSVLFNLDMGLLYHYAGVPDSSTPYFFAAERQIEDLYTKSISLAAISMVLNDNVLPYEGEDFEKVLVNVFLALNYASQGMTDDALVEARKVDLKLREYSRQYEGRNKYQEDAFIRYLAGALYENGGEVNDAFISYKKSFETYAQYEKEYGTKAPSFLLDDLVRTATKMSFDDEAETYRALGGKPYEGLARRDGSILVVVYAGKGPIKQEVRPTVSIPDDKGIIHTFQVALPKFVPRFSADRTYHVDLSTKTNAGRHLTASTEVAEDVTAIAARTLDDRLTMIYLKSGGRALLKFLASEKAKSEIKKKKDETANVLGSIAIDLFVGATEQADLRTWRTLPSQFQLARFNVPAGEYEVTVAAMDGLYTLPNQKVVVRPGRTELVIVDDVR